MKAREQIQKLTKEQKAALLQGKTVWTTYAFAHADIPEIFLSDGPHGLRKQAGAADHLGLNASVPATCFPTAAGMANSWNLELAEELGRALGEEAAANDVHVVLGPGLNIKRSPLCGRNFEYFSEDPYLAGKMAAAYVKGIQANGVAACPKHFAVNSQELRRMAMDSVLDERTLREIYLTAFEIAVKEGKAKTIMSSYNRVNGTYANENEHLLGDILRREWGFDGFVVTDWGADNVHTDGVRAGSNLVMPAPGADCALGLLKDLEEGKIDESVLDERLAELLGVINSTSEAVANAPKSFDADAHHAVAQKCAAESIVLLENDGVLPLSASAKVAVIGDFAKTPRYQGAGSSQVNPTKLDNLYDCLTTAGVEITVYAQGFDRRNPAPNQKLIDEAVEVAKGAETVLLCVGLDEILESEGMDRLHMELSKSQQELIKAVCAVNKNVILVLSGGAPFVMPERDLYRAAIHGYLGGQAGAGAMADAILGKINPSGKLNETWPLSLEDVSATPYFPSRERTAEYREGLFVGYRYFESAGVPVRYPFGYGLSYTNFAYSDIEANESGVSVTVTNTGACDGAEVVQLYVSCNDSKIYRPEKELKGFAKVFLKAGESQRVTIAFDDKTFRYFDTTDDAWAIEDSDYNICIARNAHEVVLSSVLHVAGKKASDNAPACYKTADIKNVSDADFEALLGHPIPDGKWSGEITENDALCQLYYAKGAFARFL
ncbi:MAG: glycoside hydrolase family 3 C-terminal domain-containing protein, partial [Clostridia bacterium]|nr:glycoside hydrolase family 3 C-terminal domain-containing protein [Clostridia bacterium]